MDGWYWDIKIVIDGVRVMGMEVATMGMTGGGRVSLHHHIIIITSSNSHKMGMIGNYNGADGTCIYT